MKSGVTAVTHGKALVDPKSTRGKFPWQNYVAMKRKPKKSVKQVRHLLFTTTSTTSIQLSSKRNVDSVRELLKLPQNIVFFLLFRFQTSI